LGNKDVMNLNSICFWGAYKAIKKAVCGIVRLL